MPKSFFKSIIFALAFFACVGAGLAQTDASSAAPGRPGEDVRTIRDMLTKQRLERDKKDHAEMLKRGEEALAISRQLEEAYEKNHSFSVQDKEKLESLEKIVSKIRKELGGDDDDETEIAPEAKNKPGSMREAFRFLQSTTVKMVDELKKTSRFSVSVVAIQSSNTVLQLVRFLRLRK